jgi:hypothetical protein
MRAAATQSGQNILTSRRPKAFLFQECPNPAAVADRCTWLASRPSRTPPVGRETGELRSRDTAEKRDRLMAELQAVIERILETRVSIPAQRSVLVAITRIDGCGKGYCVAQALEQLTRRGIRAAIISVDGWLNLPRVRFGSSNPADHFYRRAIRFDEMFGQLVLPLRNQRSLWLEADYVEETASEYRKQTYEFEDLTSFYWKVSTC